MSVERESLWPSDFGQGLVRPPVILLKEQARILTELTQSIVQGNVRTTEEEKQFFHYLSLVAPALGNYRYDLLRISHTIELYPVNLWYIPDSSKKTANDEDELKVELRTMFNDERTRRVIGALLAQSKA